MFKGRARLILLASMLLASGGIIWAIMRKPTPVQEPSLEVFMDGFTDSIRAVDRAGLTITRMRTSKEIELGSEIAEWIEKGRLSPHAKRIPEKRKAYVAAVLDDLLKSKAIRRRDIPYRIRVVAVDDINAFALPGGFLYVTDDLLSFVNSEAELAAIIGHEIAHVDLRHCVERIQYAAAAKKVGGVNMHVLVQIGYDLVAIGYTDELEHDADRWGAVYAESVGYHPQAIESFMQRLYEKESKERGSSEQNGGLIEGALIDYFSTHPPLMDRVVHLEKAFREQRYDIDNKSYYLGNKNVRRFTSRRESDYPDEYVNKRIYIPQE